MIRIRGILVKRREDFKRFVVFCLASLVVIAQTAVFAYIWYDFYRGLIFEPFWRKGNWVLIAIYALINVLFSRLYGGLKVGYLKRIDVFYSLTLATISSITSGTTRASATCTPRGAKNFAIACRFMSWVRPDRISSPISNTAALTWRCVMGA